MTSTPSGWSYATLREVCEVNPPNPANVPPDSTEVSFVPMAAVEAETGRIDTSETRKWKDVARAYKRFQDGDILFAKITPCMENGKAAVARHLKSGVGAGSTEFHVLRPLAGIDPDLLLFYVLQSSFREAARARMTGTAGQLRVPHAFLEEHQLPIPPAAEQTRIAGAIASYLSRLDDAVAGLERVQRNLKRYRASVLQAAVEGRLVPTEAELARAEGRDYEPASVLLERILAERRRLWEGAELERLRAASKLPKDARWKAKYREAPAPDATGSPALPEGWCWATWSQLGFSQNGRAFPSSEYQDSGVPLLRPGNLHVSGRVEWTEGNTRRLPERWAEEFPGFVVGPHELVMNLTAQSLRDEFLGRICLTGVLDRCLLNQRIARLTPVLVDARFLLWLFKSPTFRRFVDGLNKGSLIQHMFTSQLDQFMLPLPPLTEQVRIAREVERLLTLGESIERDTKSNVLKAAALRRAVLRWAFEGKLVDQDPADEPAAVLLERIRKSREAAADEPRPARARGRRRTRA